MAVFTELSDDEVKQLLQNFDLGIFISLTPIASGIENTNYFLDTSKGRWVLTVFERLTPEQLPFYLQLCDHLFNKGCLVAHPVRTKQGHLFSFVHGKPFSIANRLHGENVESMGYAECCSMGTELGKLHLAALDFTMKQPNLRGLDWCAKTIPALKSKVPSSLYEILASELEHQQAVASSPAYSELVVSACHCDLFRNNALIANPGTPMASVAGVFDFYFAGFSPQLFDLAVTMNDWCIDTHTGKFLMPLAQAFIERYNKVRPLTQADKLLWRDMLRAAALRFWTSRLYDWYCPREASLLKPHDPTHFQRVLLDRRICDLPWPEDPSL